MKTVDFLFYSRRPGFHRPSDHQCARRLCRWWAHMVALYYKTEMKSYCTRKADNNVHNWLYSGRCTLIVMHTNSNTAVLSRSIPVLPSFPSLHLPFLPFISSENCINWVYRFWISWGSKGDLLCTKGEWHVLILLSGCENCVKPHHITLFGLHLFGASGWVCNWTLHSTFMLFFQKSKVLEICLLLFFSHQKHSKVGLTVPKIIKDDKKSGRQASNG